MKRKWWMHSEWTTTSKTQPWVQRPSRSLLLQGSVPPMLSSSNWIMFWSATKSTLTEDSGAQILCLFQIGYTAGVQRVWAPQRSSGSVRLRLRFQKAVEKLPHRSLQKRLCYHEKGKGIPKNTWFRTGINDPGYIQAMQCVNYHLAAMLPPFLESENRKFFQDWLVPCYMLRKLLWTQLTARESSLQCPVLFAVGERILGWMVQMNVWKEMYSSGFNWKREKWF